MLQRETFGPMTIMAAICGVLIVFLGLISAGHNPTETQSTVQIMCLIGGLILCFLAVVLARLTVLGQRLDAFEAVAEAAVETAAPADASVEAEPAPPSDMEAADPAWHAAPPIPSGRIEAVVVTKPPL